jgi:hypothetical protein
MATAVGLNMKITADTAGIGRGVSKTEQMLGKLSKSALSAAGSLRSLVAIEIGTRLASAFSSAASAAVDYAQRVTQSVAAMDDLAQRTGASTDALQGLQVAADLAGVQSLEGALQKVTVVLGDAANGSESAQKAFSKIGLSVEDLMSLSPEDQFRAVAKAISAIPDSASQAAAAVDLFGKSGVELLPLFASNLAEIEKRAKQLGIVLSADQVSAITEMDDALLLVSKTFDGIIGQVTANLAPVVTALAEELLGFVESFNSFGGQGGTGIANVITEGLLSFAEFLAAVFDSFLSEFGSFVVSLETVAEVFRVTGNFLYGAFEYLRAIFNGFQLANSKTFELLGGVLETVGALTFNDTLTRAGRGVREDSATAAAQNYDELTDALGNVIKSGRAIGGGGTAFTDQELGVFGAAVAKARDRFENRNGTAAAGAGMASGISSQVEQVVSSGDSIVKSIADTQKANEDSWAAASKAAEEAQKEQQRFLEKRNADWVRATERITEAEAERASRAEEIEGDRLDALSRRSNQALQVSDIRSGGISEILRIASGREDPAIEEYRKQLAELRKIDSKINELRADRVQILGLGAA